jgi:hypothetical protein
MHAHSHVRHIPIRNPVDPIQSTQSGAHGATVTAVYFRPIAAKCANGMTAAALRG